MIPRTPAGTALLLAVWLTATAALRPLMLPDEGRYVGVALEMLRSGDWVVPTLDGLPYFHKPPLFYWITAGAMGLLGPHAIAARMAALLGGLAMTVGAAWFARRWLAERVAVRAPWVLATMPLAYLGAQYANLDMLVAGCISVAVLCLVDGLLRPATDLRWRRSIDAGWIAMALGVLAKGLIGVVLPLGVVVAWLLLRPDRAQVVAPAARRLVHAPAVALFAVLAVPWFVAVQLRYPEFLHYFFVYHHLQRFGASGFNNEQPFWFYLPVLALLTLPWFAWLWSAAKEPASDATAASLWRLWWTWLVLIVAFFSLPRSKLVGYIMPALLPLAFLVSASIDARFDAWRLRAARWAGATAALVCVAAVFVVARHDAGRGNAALAVALDAHAEPDAVIYAYDTQPYDLAYHLRSARPLRVVAAWSDSAIATRDDWRKELADAGRFAPGLAADVLLTPQRARAQWCAQPVSWVIAAPDAAQRESALRGSVPISSTVRLGLWRLDRLQLERAGVCP